MGTLKDSPSTAYRALFSDQALVVQTLGSAVHRMNHYPVDKYWETNCVDFYPVDSAIQPLNNQGQTFGNITAHTQ